MGTKLQELENLKAGTGCLGKAADDEPLFILRGQDMLAPDLVRRWARQAEMSAPGGRSEKAEEAYALADQMDAWCDANPTRRKMPD
jgi:hypothetical protein